MTHKTDYSIRVTFPPNPFGGSDIGVAVRGSKAASLGRRVLTNGKRPGVRSADRSRPRISPGETEPLLNLRSRSILRPPSDRSSRKMLCSIPARSGGGLSRQRFSTEPRIRARCDNMMVHSRVRCFQSLPAPSQAIEADHYRCKPVPSRNGDIGHLTKGVLSPELYEKLARERGFPRRPKPPW